MPKKIPMRTCIGCGTCKDKRELIRIVRTSEGTVIVDPGGRMNGRGAYLCADPACLEKAFRKRGLSRTFRAEVSADALAQVREALQEMLREKEATG